MTVLLRSYIFKGLVIIDNVNALFQGIPALLKNKSCAVITKEVIDGWQH